MSPLIKQGLVWMLDLVIAEEPKLVTHVTSAEGKKICNELLTAAKVLLPIIQAA